MKLQDFDFRIYDGNKKSYLTEDKLESVGLGIEKCDRIGAFLHFHDDSSIDYYIENIEIELFTGFKDVDETKIYENDIVRAISIYNSDPEILIVKTDKYGWFLSTKDGDCKDSLVYLVEENKYQLKVIGNIHENPELLGN